MELFIETYDDDLAHRSENGSDTDTYWIQRRVNTSPDVIVLHDLLRGMPIWNNAAIIDANPIRLGPGESVLHYWQPDPAHRSYVMMFDVWADRSGAPGPLVMTRLQSWDILPEPATLSLLALGGLGMIRRRRTA